MGQTAPDKRTAPRSAPLDPREEQIGHWLRGEKLQLTRVAELLEKRQVLVPYITLLRYVRSHGPVNGRRDTVRMADSAPGEVAEFDLGSLGPLANPTTGKRQMLWALPQRMKIQEM